MTFHKLRVHLPLAMNFCSLGNDISQYSDYLRANTEKSARIFCTIVYLSLKTTSTNSLIIWRNGGPGASSLMGFFIEFGPLVLYNKQDGVMRNSYSHISIRLPSIVFLCGRPLCFYLNIRYNTNT
eukprot:CFRG8650